MTELPPTRRLEFAQQKHQQIAESALDLVGQTPLIRASRLMATHPVIQKSGVELLLKCEFLSVGGSVKDRIGLAMIEDAEKTGRIQKGDTLIEATSGNTGIGMALAAAIKGYPLIITMPKKMSKEKYNMMQELGAQIVWTPDGVSFDHPESHIEIAKDIQKKTPNSHILDQYVNPSNWMAHYVNTGPEILEQTQGQLDFVVLTAGTGGTLTGVAKRVKEQVPQCTVVGVDPEGSILALPTELNEPTVGQAYKVEGIGYDFIPDVLDRKTDVDHWVKSNDKESFALARRLIRTEGLCVGGSSGAALNGAIQFIQDHFPAENALQGKRMVVLLPDSSRNYMSKFMDEDWRKAHGFED